MPMPPLDLSLPYSATHDAYRTWALAERTSAEQLHTWWDVAGAPEKAAAFRSYRLALDREERAAVELQRIVARRLAA